MTDQQNNQPGKDFNPAQHLMDIRGNQYLPVAARISWFRHDFPDGIIETEPHMINDKIAIFSARIVTPGGGIAVGYGSCTPQQFEGWVEKASTKAIGRALAAMGYGTMDIDDLDGNMSSLADSPVQGGSHNAPPRQSRNINQQRNNGFQNAPNQQQRGVTVGPGPVSDAQRKFIHSLAGERQMNNQELHDFVMNATGGTPLSDITKQQATAVIDQLKAIPNPENTLTPN